MDTVLAELNAMVAAEMEKIGSGDKKPGQVEINQIIHRGDENWPAEIRVSAMERAGYADVWDTRTREHSFCLIGDGRNLRETLAKKREDGSLVFTTIRPTQLPYRGVEKCLLHPDGPDRKIYDMMGLPVCSKSNLTNRFAVETHAQNRHKRSWAAIKQMTEQRQRDEDRARQDSLMEMLVQRTVASGQDTSK